MNPWVPLDYDSDALATLAVVKAIAQHHLPFLNPNLAAPFGANWLDFPINTTVDYIVLWALTLLSRQPGLLVNVFWLGATVFTAGTAAFAFLRLNARPWIATSLGAVYALQPFAFYRGITHLNLVFYAVPLLAAGAVELASGRVTANPRFLRSIPAYVWIACLLQGFSYVYNSFFGCFVWIVAALAAFLVRRNSRELAAGLAVVAALASFTFINLSPSLVHVARTGENPGLMYKNAAESEVYALKLRQLFTPIPNHPFPPLRWVERTIRAVHFPGDTENVTSRLGTTASLGLLFLLASALVLCLRVPSTTAPPANAITGASAMLALACLLLATQGGFGALFNTFVVPDVRAYNRIVVFVVFFSLAGLAQPLSRAWDRWTASRRPPAAAIALLLCLTVFAAYDQADTTRFLEYQDRAVRYAADESFVRSIEASLGPNALVFELPFTDFPLDFPHLQMNVYDQARPYIHAGTSAWSWGAMGEREGQWNKQTSALPAQPMVRRLCYAGFTGLWVDLGGYDPAQSPEKDLTALLGTPLRSPSGRVAFYDLRPFQTTLAADSPAVRASELAAARYPLFVDYTGGFYPIEQTAAESWRWCGKHGDIRFRNTLDRPRSVTLTMMIRTADVQPHPFLATLDGRLNRFTASASGVVFHETFTVAPRAEVRLTLASEGSEVETAPSDFRTSLYFQIVNPKVTANPE